MQPVYKWEWGLLDATTHAYCTLLPCPGVTSGPDATAKGCRRDSRQLHKLLALRSRGGQGEGVSGRNRVALAVPLKDGNLTVLPSHRQEVPFRAPLEYQVLPAAHLCGRDSEECAHGGARCLSGRGELLYSGPTGDMTAVTPQAGRKMHLVACVAVVTLSALAAGGALAAHSGNRVQEHASR